MSIPLKLHQVWLGAGPIPAPLVAYAESWRRYHPACPHVLWVDHPEVERPGPWTEVRTIPPVINGWLWQQIKEKMSPRYLYAARSDVVRLEIIAAEGGIYADLDMEFFRPIKSLLRGVRLFIADEFGGGNGNYLFGAVPNHPALWTAVRHLEGSFRKHAEADEEGKTKLWMILQITGPAFVNGSFQQYKDCVIFPYMLFNPLHPRADGAQVKQWPPCSYGNHHYAGTWYDQIKVRPDPYFLGEEPAHGAGA